MKKTDIAMIILIVTISVLAAFFVTKAIMGTPSTDTVKVKKIDAIKADITEPDPAIFNENAINPAVKVEISQDASSN